MVDSFSIDLNGASLTSSPSAALTDNSEGNRSMSPEISTVRPSSGLRHTIQPSHRVASRDMSCHVSVDQQQDLKHLGM
jgi:hypothetical protein